MTQVLSIIRSQRFKAHIFPKIGYIILQAFFIVSLTIANWDLISENDPLGIIFFFSFFIVAVFTHILYFVTGSVDPGYVSV